MYNNLNHITIFNSDLFENSTYKPNIKELSLIFDKVQKLHLNHDIVELTFNKNINYIHPLFSILLYNYYEKLITLNLLETKKIFLYIGDIATNKQYKFLHQMQQYIDYSIISIKNSKKTTYNYTNQDFLSNTYTKPVKTNILIYYSTEDSFIPAIYSNKTYKQIATMKITPFSLKNIDKDYHESNDKILSRKQLYIARQLVKPNIRAYESLNTNTEWNKILSTLLALNIQSESLTLFKNILHECTDNIQRHTQNKENFPNANGYISFYKNTLTHTDKRNEFIIYDDYEDGFLNTYKDELHKEKIRLSALHEKRTEQLEDDELLFKKIIDQYSENFTLLHNNNCNDDIIVLDKIFNTQYAFEIHQAGRITMHFGIPTLIKLIENLNSNNTLKTTLDVYMERNGNNYHISKHDNSNFYSAKKIEYSSMKGTCIFISIPFNVTAKNLFNNIEKKSLTISEYKDILEDSKPYEKIVEKFHPINVQDIFTDESPHMNSIDFHSVYIKYPDKDLCISDFFRNLFSFTYKYNINNLIIYNFDTKKYKNYINLLVDIIFPDTKRNYVNTLLNTIILDKFNNNALFIGGKNKTTMYSINKSIMFNYNVENNTILDYNPEKYDFAKIIPSPYLFIKDKDSINIFPFTLFLKDLGGVADGELLYSRMINHYLELDANSVQIHLDTNLKVHLQKFYYLKHIFENSNWINKIAFNLAYSIKKINNYEEEINKIIFIGIKKYSSLILAKTLMLLNKQNQTIIINNFQEHTELKKVYEENPDKRYIVFAPTLLSANKTNEFLKSIFENQENIIYYAAIKLKYTKDEEINKGLKQWNTFVTKDVINSICENDEYGFCKNCFDNELETPLYTISNDGYNIKNFIRKEKNNIPPRTSEIQNITSINWKNSIKHAHVERSSTHYQYYTRTISLLKNNSETILSELYSYQLENESTLLKDSIINIIIAPNHLTNSNFITLVNKQVFNNNAIVHLFDLNYNIDNEYHLSNLKKYYHNQNHLFHFIDDEISSGRTLSYYHNILQKISNAEKFETIFILVNRISSHNFSNLGNLYFKSFYTYTNLSIPPIKTQDEDCYLCKKESLFKVIAEESSIVFVKHQIDKKIKKLELKKSEMIDYSHDSQIVDFKDFIKMKAFEYIDKNIDNILDIAKEIDTFSRQIKEYFYKYYLEIDFRSEHSNIDIIINNEAKLIFLKLLSFPKISYHENIRALVHKFIIKEIKNIKNSKEAKAILNSKKINQLRNASYSTKIKNIIDAYDSLNGGKERTEFDYFNFLVTIAAQLKINYILHHTVIDYFFLMNYKFRKNNTSNIKKELLYKYHIAVKMLTSYSEEKSLYFNSQYKKYISIKENTPEYDKKGFYNKYNSLMFALSVENVQYKMKYKKLFQESLNTNTEIKLDKKITHLKNTIETTIYQAYPQESKLGHTYDLHNISLYVDINKNISSYKLVNIFDNFNENINDKYVNLLFKGAIRNRFESNQNSEAIELVEQVEDHDIFNVWVNYYREFKLEEITLSKTYIRIFHQTRKKTIPIGVFVIEHSKSFKIHTNISRLILMLQQNIISYIKNHNLISNEVYNDKISINTHNQILGNLNHDKDNPLYVQTISFLNKFTPDNLDTNRNLLNDYMISYEYQSLNNFSHFNAISNETYKITSAIDLIFVEKLYIYFNARNHINPNKEMKTNPKIKINIEYIHPKLKKDILQTDLHTNILQAIIFELSVNAYKRLKRDAQVLNICIFIIGGSLYISNTATEEPDATTIFKNGNGLSLIKYILKIHSYNIEYIKIDTISNEDISNMPNIKKQLLRSTFILQIKKDTNV